MSNQPISTETTSTETMPIDNADQSRTEQASTELPIFIPTTNEIEIFRRVSVEGVSSQEIATQLKLSQLEIRRIVARMKRWTILHPCLEELELLKLIHLRRLENMWSEAMDAWYRSKIGEEMTEVSKGSNGNSAVKKRNKTSAGNPSFLREARELLVEIRQLLGVSTPIDFTHFQQELPNVESLTPEQRRAEILKFVMALRDLGGESPPVGTTDRDPQGEALLAAEIP